MKIVDLARQLIRLAGQAAEEIAIEFTGLRVGEKPYEELLADADDTLPTAVPWLRVARLAVNTGNACNAGKEGPVDELLARLVAAAATDRLQDDAAVRARLRAVVAEYGQPRQSVETLRPAGGWIRPNEFTSTFSRDYSSIRSAMVE